PRAVNVVVVSRGPRSRGGHTTRVPYCGLQLQWRGKTPAASVAKRHEQEGNFRGQARLRRSRGAGSGAGTAGNEAKKRPSAVARILNLLGGPGRRTTMTNAKRGRSTDTPTTPTAVRVATQKVVIINGSPEILELLETVLDAGHYDIIFVESSEHAYSQIKRVKPDLVIL